LIFTYLVNCLISKTVRKFLHNYDYSCFVDLINKLKSNQIITESKHGYKLCSLVLRMIIKNRLGGIMVSVMVLYHLYICIYWCSCCSIFSFRSSICWSLCFRLSNLFDQSIVCSSIYGFWLSGIFKPFILRIIFKLRVLPQW
jgi:hypothetical protein